MGQWLLPSCFSKVTEAGWKHMSFSCFDKNALFTSQNCFLWHNRHGNPNNSRGFRTPAGLTRMKASVAKKIYDMVIIVPILKSRILNQMPLFLPDIVLSRRKMQKLFKGAPLWETLIVCHRHAKHKKHMMVQVREGVNEEQPHSFCKACTDFFSDQTNFLLMLEDGPAKYMCTILKLSL